MTDWELQMTNRLKYILTALICALLLLTGCGSSVERDYRTGEEYLEQGKFGEAAEIFGALGSFRDASRLLMYSRAALAAENGDFGTAYQAFTVLGDFRDSPEMLRYYQAREEESAGRGALAAADYPAALPLLKSAAARYAALPSFRDAGQRGADCLGTLYGRGCELMDGAEYDTAQEIFTSLEAYRDSADRKAYCEAALLEADGAYLEAAARFSELSSLPDAAARADANRETVYREALALCSAGDLEGAVSLFTALGSYRDAETQRTDTIRLLIRDRLQRGDYEGALYTLDSAPDAVSLQPAEEETRQRAAAFLDGFVNAYLLFSSGSTNAYEGYAGVVPYVDRGGALENRFRQVLMIGSHSHNSYYIYYGSELLDLFLLEGDCYLAYVRASASVNQPVGPVEVTRTFRILVRDSADGMIAGTLDDFPYGGQGTSGRPIVTGPLPGGELPPDEDGDGIILADVMKKGFQGTMIIVLDPSRVFVGGPGFYGGNGMLLEELVLRYDALGGINGGGFIDEDGGGSGGFPEGLTILEGKSYCWATSGESAAFDGNNVLHVGYYTTESAAAAGIRDCVSFGPALVVDGVGQYGRHMQSGINPRTAIGQREDGAVLMLCIDGRQLHSIGANFGDIRDVMLDFGAVNACSLDGGSSTVMYLNGEYLNSPSSASGTSRYLPNAFLIKK